ncbi:MAG TPA: heme-copper oxidase subunit III [Chitinophaga sp.]|uniref:cytochrome c oxidase subunit 3 n=1 Tax=Chitinophaga sp. TaxID=1869181 RepID=UPI002DBA1D21|nr:heme-copper oxidase subunit III [Chitinophaga sp.]HEU4552250.1 heme-copper oxidase subunit III [Chitinophaga sp.]
MENKLMMKLVIGTEALFFLSLIVAYVYFSKVTGFAPAEVQRLSIKTTGLFSVLLFSSSFTFERAAASYKHGRIKHLKLWLLATIALGAIFLCGQGIEYTRLLREHVSPGGSMFGSSFFTLTGFHGLHVFAGLVLLAIIATMAFLGDFDRRRSSSAISTIGMYWHFVDVVWLFVFTIIYVLPHL